MIYKIVLTGGPCGGKSTAINHLKQILQERGYCVLCFPEVPTIFFQGGIELEMLKGEERMASFEDGVVKLQLSLESIGEEYARVLKPDNCPHAVLIFDRGLLDPGVYMKPGSFDELLRDNRMTVAKILEFYHLAIHMVSAADGAPEHYGNANNPARSESLDFARWVEQRTLAAYGAHPNRVIIPNVVEGKQITFAEKLKLAEKAVVEFLAKKSDK